MAQIDLRTAQVFSDPPINIAPARKEGPRLVLDPSSQANVSWPLGAAAAALPDGDYQFAIRPHHVRIDGEVRVAELSGSESVVHFNLGPHAWVSQSHGVHRFDVGDRVGFAIEVDRALLFRPDGSLAHAS